MKAAEARQNAKVEAKSSLENATNEEILNEGERRGVVTRFRPFIPIVQIGPFYPGPCGPSW